VQEGIAQTLINHRKRLNQCSRCGDPNHFWRKCPAATPVVASAKLERKRTFNEAGYQDHASIPKARRIEAPPPAVKRVEADIHGSGRKYSQWIRMRRTRELPASIL